MDSLISLHLIVTTLFTVLVHGYAVGAGLAARESDANVIANFAQTGLCMGYMGRADLDKELSTCRTWCQKPKNGGNADGVGCMKRTEGQPGYDPSMMRKDDAGTPYIPGKCTCTVKSVVMPILEVVMKGLAQLDKFIPGGQTLVAAKYAVQGAKTFVENGLEVASFFGNVMGWQGMRNPKGKGPDNKDNSKDGNNDAKKEEERKKQEEEAKKTEEAKKKEAEEAKKTEDAKKKESEEAKKANDQKVESEAKKKLEEKEKMDKAKKEEEAAAAKKANEQKVESEAKHKLEEKERMEKAKKEEDDKKAAETERLRKEEEERKAAEEKKKTEANDKDKTTRKSESDRPVSTKSDRPSSTRSDESSRATPTTTENACRIQKRAANEVTREWLAPETNIICPNGKDKEAHVTYTPKESVGYYTSVIPKKCPKKCGQACHNYRSIISVHTNTPDMHRFTCDQYPDTSKDGEATNTWGVTALTKRAGTAQHWWPWANGFVTLSSNIKLDTNNVLVTNYKGCERDEWPPRYFWPGDVEAKKRNMVQRVRLLPSDENSCGGRVWMGFCGKNNARSDKKVNSQTTYPIVRSKFIDVKSRDLKPKKEVGKDGITTFRSTVSIDTMRAIFTFDDNWDGVAKLKDDGLWENTKCWPTDLAPNDPGFALLTYDEWYMTQRKDLQVEAAKYTELPPLALIQAALKKHGGNPPFGFKTFTDEADFVARLGPNHDIPDVYRLGGAILPGVPAPPSNAVKRPAPPKIRRQAANETIEEEWVVDEDEEVNVSEYSDEELDQWMDAYGKLLREREEMVRLSRPRDTLAVATPVGQGGPMPTPALKRTVATAGMPQMTMGF